MSDLGRPGVPYRVQVRCVWNDHYRVNVFLGDDPTAFKLAHSYS